MKGGTLAGMFALKTSSVRLKCVKTCSTDPAAMPIALRLVRSREECYRRAAASSQADVGNPDIPPRRPLAGRSTSATSSPCRRMYTAPIPMRARRLPGLHRVASRITRSRRRGIAAGSGRPGRAARGAGRPSIPGPSTPGANPPTRSASTNASAKVLQARLGLGQRLLDREQSRHDPLDIAVHHIGAAGKGDRGDGRRRIGADAGQKPKLRFGVRKHAAMVPRHGPCASQQIAGAGVVAKTCPGRHHLGIDLARPGRPPSATFG